MPEIQLQIKDTREPGMIVLGSTSDKFDFSLDVVIEAAGPKPKPGTAFLPRKVQYNDGNDGKRPFEESSLGLWPKTPRNFNSTI